MPLSPPIPYAIVKSNFDTALLCCWSSSNLWKLRLESSQCFTTVALSSLGRHHTINTSNTSIYWREGLTLLSQCILCISCNSCHSEFTYKSQQWHVVANGYKCQIIDMGTWRVVTAGTFGFPKVIIATRVLFTFVTTMHIYHHHHHPLSSFSSLPMSAHISIHVFVFVQCLL